MKVTIASLWSAFFALDSLSSTRVLAQVIKPVEYTFNDASDPTKNTGIGDPYSSLDGVPFPVTDNGISFVDGEGRDGSTVANFAGRGAIQVPDSVEINRGPTENRMVSLDFKWDGTKREDGKPQVLFDQGEYNSGLNIYLRTIDSNDNAELNMQAWMSPVSSYRKSLRTNYDIEADRWYTATLVLDATASTFSGYLDDEEFGSMEIDFLPLSGDSDGNGLGGASGNTCIFSSGRRVCWNNGPMYFHGQIDNFCIRNYYPLATTAVVEYAFTDDSNRYKNTGDGGSSSPSSLNGIPTPIISHGVAFQGIGAGFTHSGCIQVPTNDNINGVPGQGVGDRTISLSFKWGGSDSNLEPEILWEEGGRQSGMNMYLDPINNSPRAFLVMAVWETTGGVFVAAHVQKTTIHADVWYHASLVLQRDGTSSDGTLTGYLDSVPFGQVDVDFFGISRHPRDNCIGGMKSHTRIFSTDGSGASEGMGGDGLYFNGYIDKFRLINLAEHPVLPTASPTNSPSPTNVPTTSTFPTTSPTDAPSTSPTNIPTAFPTTSPTDAPSTSPTSIPTAFPTSTSPTASPSMFPTTSQLPTTSPTASPSMSLAPTTDPLMVVEYMFDNSTDRMGNTGDGDPEVSLDGILFPESDNGISFLEANEGNGFAKFTGTGCIQVPTCNEINKQFIDRTIMLNFLWDGTVTTDPQILFEEGSGNNGVNIYLRSFVQGTAELVMAAWKTKQGQRVSKFVNTTIEADKGYQTSMVLDRFGKTSDGLLQGYLNGVEFAQVPMDFYIRDHYRGDNCLGGMKLHTFIVDSADSNGDGFYFHGLIDDFRLFNSVQDPGIWEAPPVLSPSLVPPTARPTDSPSASPTVSPSMLPTTSPSASPSMLPTMSELSSSAQPSVKPSSQPSMSLTPSAAPSNEVPSWLCRWFGLCE